MSPNLSLHDPAFVGVAGAGGGVTCADPFDGSGANWTNDATVDDIQIDTVSYPDQLAWVNLEDYQGEIAYRTICGETLDNGVLGWYMNYNQKFTGGAAQACFIIQCCSNSTAMNLGGAGTGTSADVDCLGMYFHSDVNGYGRNHLLYKDGSDAWVKSANAVGSSMRMTQGRGTLYFQQSRQTETVQKMSAFTDSDYTVNYVDPSPDAQSSPIQQTIPSTVQNLTTWQSLAYGQTDSASYPISLQLKDLQMYNGVLP